MLFELEFPITRRYTWPYFTPVVLTASAMCLVVLAILNVQLVGFETITRLEEDFNITQSFWTDHVIPNGRRRSRTLCQPLVLKMGDSFVTDSSMFLWDLELVAKTNDTNDSASSLVYTGSTLQGCDVSALYLNGDMSPPILDIVAVISCKDLDGFDVIGKTAFPISMMPGTYTRFTGKQSSFANLARVLPYELIELGAEDLLSHIFAMMSDRNLYPAIIGASAEISYTPCQALLEANAPCASNPPPVNISSSLVISSNGTSTYSVFSENSKAIDDRDIYAPIANIIQTIHATVKIDLGIAHKNNFLLNPSVLNTTLYSEFPAAVLPQPTVSTLYQRISQGSFPISTTFPLKVEGPAKLQARYLCQLQQMKTPAQLFIAVLVATLSMFSGGWGLFMLLATYWAKRGNASANSCVTHDSEVEVGMPLLPRMTR